MFGSLHLDIWSRFVLSLILLAANIGAPFRSSALGRVFPGCLRQHVATSSVVRVRAVSPGGASHGFRAVVGLAEGGPDEADLGSRSQAISAVLPSATASLPMRHGDRPVARPHPPLRC